MLTSQNNTKEKEGRAMILERITSKGLAHFSYLVGSDGEGAVIDPRRDCGIYVERARRLGMRIRYVFETHRHEDFVTGSVDLSRITGSTILHGPGTPFAFGSTVYDGQEFALGKIRLKALHTPGHTVESMSYALYDTTAGNAAVAVFTGDTLFANGVGRADLEGPVPEMAGLLYDSITGRLIPLGDGAAVFPAHGEGSVCGIGIGKRTVSSIGVERALNPALQVSREEFVRQRIEERHELPAYFKNVEKWNTDGPPPMEGPPRPAPLRAEEISARLHQDALVVDVRTPAAFSAAHIGGSYSLWLDGLASFAGFVLPVSAPVLLVAERLEDADRAARYLLRMSYDRIEGYLHGGLETWYAAGYTCESVPFLPVRDLAQYLSEGRRVTVLDVRSIREWESGHIEGALHIPAGQLERRTAEVPGDGPIATICGTGNRSSFASSILRRRGFTDVHTVLGGMTAWRNMGR
jgi:hydroxyacylglutathione hydrolase